MRTRYELYNVRLGVNGERRFWCAQVLLLLLPLLIVHFQMLLLLLLRWWWSLSAIRLERHLLPHFESDCKRCFWFLGLFDSWFVADDRQVRANRACFVRFYHKWRGQSCVRLNEIMSECRVCRVLSDSWHIINTRTLTHSQRVKVGHNTTWHDTTQSMPNHFTLDLVLGTFHKDSLDLIDCCGHVCNLPLVSPPSTFNSQLRSGILPITFNGQNQKFCLQ